MKTALLLCLALAAAATVTQALKLAPLPTKRFSDKPLKTFLIPDAKPYPRISRGSEVSAHSLPYQVALYVVMDSGRSVAFCGGSLISNQWVLTSAQCAEPGESFTVVLGAHTIGSGGEASQVHMKATDKIVHPDWSRDTLHNDVALIKLPSAVHLNENIASIRLPSHGQADESFVGVTAMLSGWGNTSDGDLSTIDALRAVKRSVISNAECKPYYSGNFNQASHICTSGTDAPSTCSGDSGGPLVVSEADGEKTLIGVLSFGVSMGCEIDWPPVFTRLSSYVSWISVTTGVPISR